MIVLKQSTFDKIQRAMKYPSITGGLGVRVDRQPGGGISLSIPPVTDGGGRNVGSPPSPPPSDPDVPYIFPPFEPPYDPFEPSSVS